MAEQAKSLLQLSDPVRKNLVTYLLSHLSRRATRAAPGISSDAGCFDEEFDSGHIAALERLFKLVCRVIGQPHGGQQFSGFDRFS